MSSFGGDRTGCVSSTKFAVEFHDLSHQSVDQILAKHTVLPRGQFGHGLRDSLDNFVRFFRIDHV